MALDTKNKCMGVGVIVRDHKGLIQAALSKTINCLHPLVKAEAVGVLQVVEFCCDLGLHDVVLKGDSFLLWSKIFLPQFQVGALIGRLWQILGWFLTLGGAR